jgi:hypothetical protein
VTGGRFSPLIERRYNGRLDEFQRMRCERFVIHVQPGQFLSRLRERPEHRPVMLSAPFTVILRLFPVMLSAAKHLFHFGHCRDSSSSVG